MTISKICDYCGLNAKTTARFCPNCGQSLSNAPVSGPVSGSPALGSTVSLALQAHLPPGHRFKSRAYTVVRQFGVGGMGAVYLAKDHDAFDRLVVIKRVLDMSDADAQAMFLSEAQTLTRLKHPNIARIYAFFTEDQVGYIAMEYVDGSNLADLLHNSGQPFSAEQVAEWGVHVCKILEYLQKFNPPIVHHDIKPENILLERESGELMLIDFGIAKPRQQLRSGSYQKTELFGTLGYAPPEQPQGMSEPRSDVFALAATLYHLATNDDPRDHPYQFPLLPQLPTPLQAALEQALVSEVAKRSSASDLRQQLEQFLALKNSPALIAPDRTALAGAEELGDWCKQNPDEAITWIRSRLPEQIANVWGNTPLANELYKLRTQYAAHPYAMLDLALAAMQPQLAPPKLRWSPDPIALGKLSASKAVVETNMTFYNDGDRYMYVQLKGNAGLSDIDTSFDLPPGGQHTLRLAAKLGSLAAADQWQGAVVCKPHNWAEVQIPVTVKLSPLQSFWQRWCLPWLNLRTWRSALLLGVLGALYTLGMAHAHLVRMSNPELYTAGGVLAVWLVTLSLLARAWRRNARRTHSAGLLRRGVFNLLALGYIALTAQTAYAALGPVFNHALVLTLLLRLAALLVPLLLVLLLATKQINALSLLIAPTLLIIYGLPDQTLIISDPLGLYDSMRAFLQGLVDAPDAALPLALLALVPAAVSRQP